MGIIRLLLKSAFAAGLVFLATCLMIAGFAWSQPRFEPAPFVPADVIVVLGAGMDADGVLHPSSLLRVDKGVALYLAGAAPKMHFTGGRGAADGPGAGTQMAAYAQSLGVPDHAISFEDESQSTLQNALFSQPMLANATRLILVTEGYHLPRAWASFKWAGDHDLALAHSTAFREATPGSNYPALSMVVREALAWWFNFGRALAWTVAGLFGVIDNTRNGWLA